MKMNRALFGHPEKEQPEHKDEPILDEPTRTIGWIGSSSDGRRTPPEKKGSDMSVNNKPRSNQSVH